MKTKYKKCWTDNGFTTYKSKTHFFAEIGVEDFQGDGMFYAILSMFRRAVKFTYWFNNSKTSNSWSFTTRQR